MLKPSHTVRALLAAVALATASGGALAQNFMKDKAEVEKLNVRGFPSIIYMKGGKPMEYSGERSYDGVISFLNSA